MTWLWICNNWHLHQFHVSKMVVEKCGKIKCEGDFFGPWLLFSPPLGDQEGGCESTIFREDSLLLRWGKSGSMGELFVTPLYLFSELLVPLLSPLEQLKGIGSAFTINGIRVNFVSVLLQQFVFL